MTFCEIFHQPLCWVYIFTRKEKKKNISDGNSRRRKKMQKRKLREPKRKKMRVFRVSEQVKPQPKQARRGDFYCWWNLTIHVWAITNIGRLQHTRLTPAKREITLNSFFLCFGLEMSKMIYSNLIAWNKKNKTVVFPSCIIIMYPVYCLDWNRQHCFSKSF